MSYNFNKESSVEMASIHSEDPQISMPGSSWSHIDNAASQGMEHATYPNYLQDPHMAFSNVASMLPVSEQQNNQQWAQNMQFNNTSMAYNQMPTIADRRASTYGMDRFDGPHRITPLDLTNYAHTQPFSVDPTRTYVMSTLPPALTTTSIYPASFYSTHPDMYNAARGPVTAPAMLPESGVVPIGYGPAEGINLNLGSSEKPAYPLSTIIAYAIATSPHRRLTLSEIYAWMLANLPYYRQCSKNWKNTVRHTLSMNKTFVKIEKTLTDLGKGCFWTLDASLADKALKKARRGSEPYNRERKPSLLHAAQDRKFRQVMRAKSIALPEGEMLQYPQYMPAYPGSMIPANFQHMVPIASVGIVPSSFAYGHDSPAQVSNSSMSAVASSFGDVGVAGTSIQEEDAYMMHSFPEELPLAGSMAQDHSMAFTNLAGASHLGNTYPSPSFIHSSNQVAVGSGASTEIAQTTAGNQQVETDWSVFLASAPTSTYTSPMLNNNLSLHADDAEDLIIGHAPDTPLTPPQVPKLELKSSKRAPKYLTPLSMDAIANIHQI